MAILVPTIHPAAALHGTKPITDIIAADLAKGWRIAREGPSYYGTIIPVLPSSRFGLEGSFKAALAWIEHWDKICTWVAVDVETSSLNYFNCKLYSIALSGMDDNEVAISFTLCDYHTIRPDLELALVKALTSLLANPEVGKIYHNAPYDQAVLSCKGFPLAGQIYDTQAGAHLFQPDIPKDLGWVGQTYLDCRAWKVDHKGNKLAFTRDPDELLYYNGEDALNTQKIVRPQMKDLYQRGVSQELIQWQMRYAQLATDIEIAGTPVDMELRRKMGMDMMKSMAKKKIWMREFLNWPDFNPMSGKHRMDALFSAKYATDQHKLGIRPQQWTPPSDTHPDGQPSTSYKSPHIIEKLEHPFVRRLVDYMETKHAYSTQYRESHQWEVWKLNELGLAEELKDFRRNPPKHEHGGAYQRAMFDDGRLHVKVNPCGQKGVRFSTSPNCFDAETEVLTSEGWVAFPKAVKNAANLRFAQYNPASEIITFGRALQTHHYKKQHVLNVESQQVNLCATPHHRILLREYNPNVHSKKIEVLSLEDLPRHKRFVHAGHYSFGRRGAGEALLRLIVACQADGSWSKKAIRFDFKFERKYRRLRMLLDAVGAKYTARERPEEPKHRWYIYMNTSALTKTIEGYIGQGRIWGAWLLDLPKCEALAFLDEVGHWNGQIEKNRIFYYSATETNTNWVQIIAILNGFRATTCWAGTTYRTSISKYKAFSSGRVEPTTCNQLKDVYCITVPRGFILVRRRGRAVIVGNCQNQRLEDRIWSACQPGRALVGSDKDQLELRICACLAGVESLLPEMQDRSGDPHTVAAREVYGDAFEKRSPKERVGLRKIVKAVVYASIYMAGLNTVWKTVRERKELKPEERAAMTLPVVSHIYHGYFGLYPEYAKYHESKLDIVKRDGCIRCVPFNRPRFFPIYPPPFTELANWDVQTGGADIVTSEMCMLQDELKRRYHGTATIVGHYHDQYVLECNAGDAEAIKQLGNQIFGNTRLDGPKGPVYLTADSSIGSNMKAVK